MKRLHTIYFCLAGAIGAIALQMLALGGHPLTFMADDYVHLQASYANPPRLFEHFTPWLGRVPVWSFLMVGIFSSHVFEGSWNWMFVFFACHCTGLALIAAYVSNALATPRLSRADPLFLSCATCVFCLYPNFYEIIYWPTCMPYSVGCLLLGLAFTVRHRVLQGGLLCLSFLTYETFIFPSYVLLALQDSSQKVSLPVRFWKATLLFLPALVGAVATRVILGHWLGHFSHQIDLSLAHIIQQMWSACQLLVSFRFYGTHTNIPLTIVFVFLLLGGMFKIKFCPRSLPFVLLGVPLSSAIYWFLGYGASRAVYGSQLLLCALLIAILAQRWRPFGFSSARGMVILFLLGTGFTLQSQRLWRIKHHNAAVLAAQENDLQTQLVGCVQPCSIAYSDLSANLKPDWVLPVNFWPPYLDYLHLKYAAEKKVVFLRIDKGTK